MAEGLTVALIPVRIVRDTWRQLESIYMGRRVRLFDNTNYSSERDEKRAWEGDAYFLDATEENALRAAAPRGVAVNVNGVLVGGVAIGAFVDFGPSDYKYVSGPSGQELHRTCPLHIEEV